MSLMPCARAAIAMLLVLAFDRSAGRGAAARYIPERPGDAGTPVPEKALVSVLRLKSKFASRRPARLANCAGSRDPAAWQLCAHRPYSPDKTRNAPCP